MPRVSASKPDRVYSITVNLSRNSQYKIQQLLESMNFIFVLNSIELKKIYFEVIIVFMYICMFLMLNA